MVRSGKQGAPITRSPLPNHNRLNCYAVGLASRAGLLQDMVDDRPELVLGQQIFFLE